MLHGSIEGRADVPDQSGRLHRPLVPPSRVTVLLTVAGAAVSLLWFSRLP